jgi:hypothetical protein
MPNESSVQIVINKEVQTTSQTILRENAGTSSRNIGYVDPNVKLRATLDRNSFYFIPEKKGWIMKSRVKLIEDLSANSTQETTEESQDKVRTLDQETLDKISQMTPEEKKDIYMQYVNSEYGDTQDAGNVADSLLVDNLSGIYGIPYQFPESVDPRPDSKSLFGSIYAERIITRMPLLMMSPGKVDFMSSYKTGEKKAVLDVLLNDGDGASDINDFLEKPGKYYTFAYDTENYWKYVNAANQASAIYLGIGDVEIDVNGVKAKAADFKWEKASNNKFDSLLVSNKSYVCFYTDADSSKSESFGNDTTSSQLADKVNDFSSIAKEIQFLVGANTGIDIMQNQSAIDDALTNLGNVVDKFIGGSQTIKDLGEDFVTIASGGKLIFPEIWSDSTFSQSFDVKIKLRCPCPNKVSWFLDIIVPINHLIALTMPRSPYGKSIINKDFDQEPSVNGYMSPFLVRAFYKGLFNCDMGIITDLSIEKGKEGSWTLDGLPSEVDISMTIKDLYNVMAMSEYTTGNQRKSFLNNTTYLNYLANSCGISINKPDLDRSLDLWAMIQKNYWKDKLTGYTWWQKASQGGMNKLYNMYTGVFKG